MCLVTIIGWYQWREKSSNLLQWEMGMSELYMQHDQPWVIQHDQGLEFEGAVKKLCNSKSTWSKDTLITNSDRVKLNECIVHVGKKRQMYDFLTMKKYGGVNWVKLLPEYAKTLNIGPQEEMSWKSAFEVYYGHKGNYADRLSKLHIAQEY